MWSAIFIKEDVVVLNLVKYQGVVMYEVLIVSILVSMVCKALMIAAILLDRKED